MMSVHERVYRSMLVVYPREHRLEYAEPMTQLLRDRLRDSGGGTRVLLVWLHTIGDLIRTALAERKVATMDTFKQGWWRYSAGVIAFGMVFLAVGNLFGEDEGPYWGKVLATAVALVFAALIVAGLRIRPTRKGLGSILTGIGVLPGAGLVAIIWFPPVFALGVLSIATAGAAFGDAARRSDAAGVSG